LAAPERNPNGDGMANETMRKFGYPESLIAEFDHWAVLVRPAQVTLGSLVLAAKSEVRAFSALPSEAFAEQSQVIRTIETALGQFCAYERINYLMLMMVDRQVHFHVIPRYSEPRLWNGISFVDHGWPTLPELKLIVDLDRSQICTMRDQLETLFSYH
jgi:diadenosine tetraphosphate (Ap4A) HIT family hydrolase